LRVIVSGEGNAAGQIAADLAIVVAVIDGQYPNAALMMRTTETVVGVSAGAATADQLGRVVASASGDGRSVAGILVADPDPTDRTTGRLPQLTRLAQRRSPDASIRVTPSRIWVDSQ
jgi:hypothetical protein